MNRKNKSNQFLTCVEYLDITERMVKLHQYSLHHQRYGDYPTNIVGSVTMVLLGDHCLRAGSRAHLSRHIVEGHLLDLVTEHDLHLLFEHHHPENHLFDLEEPKVVAGTSWLNNSG